MEPKVLLDAVYIPSEDVVAREIEGELVIIPLTAGIGDVEDELFSLNETGRAIWDKLDEKKTLNDLVEELSKEFKAEKGELEQDVAGFLKELLKRGIVIEIH